MTPEREIKFRAWVIPKEDEYGIFNNTPPYMVVQGEPDVETLSSFIQ